MSIQQFFPSAMIFPTTPQPDNRRRSIARRPFTVEEDAKLMEIMNSNNFVNWETVAQKMGDRSSRQCRERWVNYLSPEIRTDPWSDIEDRLLIQKMNELGRCWSTIGQFFNGRSENDIKNRWYSHLRYRSIERNGVIQIVSDPSLTPFPERKKRKRTKICPKQNALRILEQQKSNFDRELDEISSSPNPNDSIPTSPFNSPAMPTFSLQNPYDIFSCDQTESSYTDHDTSLTLDTVDSSESSETLDTFFWNQNLFDGFGDTKFQQEFDPYPNRNLNFQDLLY